jgi:cytochrome c peroxidase
MTSAGRWICHKLALCVILLICGLQDASAREPERTLGLPPLPVIHENPQTPQKVALGRRLFFDTRLSANGEVACSTCHQPERAFTDTRAVAQGIAGRQGTRNTPTVINAAFNVSQFWDGRRASIEEQAGDPFINPLEHGLADHRALLALVAADPGYVGEFKGAFGVTENAITMERLAMAIASFVRTLIAGDSAFDRYFYGGDPSALSDAAKRGFALFRGRAQCAMCHTIGEHHATFNDDRFHSVGVGLRRIAERLSSLATRVAQLPKAEIDSLIGRDPEVAALGRFSVTRDPSDIGKFKTPSLRNVAVTGPYMHDGSVVTLADAIDHELYYRGHVLGRPLILTPAEKADLSTFLQSLTSSNLPR